MLQRDKAKEAAQKSENYHNKQLYFKLRNKVRKFNYIEKREYYKKKIRCAAGDSKKLCKNLN